ncbi:MAG: hypothetical protein EZS28_052906, partial [Streblomastix strix]
NRNSVIFASTTNRNPFIDHPELALILYGTTAQSAVRFQKVTSLTIDVTFMVVKQTMVVEQKGAQYEKDLKSINNLRKCLPAIKLQNQLGNQDESSLRLGQYPNYRRRGNRGDIDGTLVKQPAVATSITLNYLMQDEKVNQKSYSVSVVVKEKPIADKIDYAKLSDLLGFTITRDELPDLPATATIDDYYYWSYGAIIVYNESIAESYVTTYESLLSAL